MAGLVIITMAATGAMMAFEHQIVDWAEKDVRIVAIPAPGAQRMTLDDIAAAAQKEKPKGKVSAITLKNDPTASAVVSFGREGTLYVNPYTGLVLGGESKAHDALHFIEDIHRFLGKREIGKPITGAANFAFFILLVSGLYIWIPSKWTKRNVKRIAVFGKELKGKARDWNWHNVIGIWLSPFILITTLTGLIMSYTWATNLLYHATGNEPPPAQNQQRPMGGKPGEAKKDDMKKEEPPVQLAAFDLFAANAISKVTAWEAVNIRLPQKPGGPVTANILEDDPTYGIPVRSALQLDAATAEPKKWEPFAEANMGRVLRVWARYLHTGDVGGLPGQIVAFLSACGITLMVWTGISLSLRRYAQWRSENRRMKQKHPTYAKGDHHEHS